MSPDAGFVAELTAELQRTLPGSFVGELRLHVDDGRVSAPLRVLREDHAQAEGGWPSATFSRDLVAWIQARTRPHWWGSIRVVIRAGRVHVVAVEMTFHVAHDRRT